MLRSLPRRFPPPVLVRLGALSLRICPEHLPSGRSRFPLGPGEGRTWARLEQTGTKRRCKPHSGPSLLRLIHCGRGEPSPGCFLEGWGSTLLLSFCAEQRARGLEEERGRWLRGLAALVLPLPGLPPPLLPSGKLPLLTPLQGCLAWEGPSGGPWLERGKPWWRLRTRPDVPSASVLLQLLGIMEVAVSVSPCLTVYNMATFL